VIEAATEDLETKKKILSLVESVVREIDHHIQHSGILANQIFSHLKHPRERRTPTFSTGVAQHGCRVIAWEKSDKKSSITFSGSWLRTGKHL